MNYLGRSLVKLINEAKMKRPQQPVEGFTETIQLPHEFVIPTIKALYPVNMHSYLM